MRSAAAVTLATLVLAVGVTTTVLAQRPQSDDALALTARIDASLEKSWKEAQVEPAPAADELQFQRRLWLDVLGTLPSLEEIRALEAVAPERKHAWLIDRAFADPRFADALAERLARIAVGAGRKPDDLFYRRRRLVEWLREQVQERRPWDEIVRALLTTEGFSTDAPAVNFVISQDADPAKLAGRTARAFLGVRIDCAQCHDHPFADWKQSDFEGLAAFFARTKRKGPYIHEEAKGDFDIEDRKDGTLRRVEPHVPFDKEALPAVDEGSKKRPKVTRRDALAAWVTDSSNVYFARAIVNRTWAWLLGTGFREPVDELDQGKPSNPELLALLELDTREHRFDLVRLVRAIVSTRAYALASKDAPGHEEAVTKKLAAFALYPLKPLHPDQLASAVFQATSFQTQDESRPLLLRIARSGQTSDFVTQHGGDLDAETPEDETLLQRHSLMDGKVMRERLKDGPISVPSRLVVLAPSDRKIVEVAYLMALSRVPTPRELEHFEARLRGLGKREKIEATQDLVWALLNSVEFAWNH